MTNLNQTILIEMRAALRIGSEADLSTAIARAIPEMERMYSALEPFARLAGSLDMADNLVGLLTSNDFRRAAEAYSSDSHSTMQEGEK